MNNKLKSFTYLLIIEIILFTLAACPGEEDIPYLSGIVRIIGTAQVGQTLTTDTSKLNGDGIITYQWMRDNAIVIGSDRTTYSLTTADVDSTVTVTVTRSGYSGSITSTQTDIIVPSEATPGLAFTLIYNTEYSVSIGTATATFISIPKMYKGLPVTRIEEKGFYEYTTMTNISIPDSVTSIGFSAFSGCSSLTSITIPNSVTSIGIFAFENCSSLTNVTIPNSVTSIGYSTFSNCTSLTSVTIPNSVTIIYNYAFSGCSSLTSITIPNSVTSIGIFAFENCSSLTNVTIPNSVTSIGYSTFSNCTSLTSVTIPNSVIIIYNDAFRNCTGLTSVFYGGANISAWNAITIYDNNNTSLTNATRYYYSVTNPGTANTHWRWVDGVATVW